MTPCVKTIYGEDRAECLMTGTHSKCTLSVISWGQMSVVTPPSVALHEDPVVDNKADPL